MKILMAYYSKTGYTKYLTTKIAEKLEAEGHTLFFEEIESVEEESKWPFLWKEIWFFPSVGLTIFSYLYSEFFSRNMKFPEKDIKPLRYPDVSQFDRILIGSPKHALVSYSVTRYLKSIKGLNNKKVGLFATFAGPPFRRFEVEAIFRTAGNIIERRGAKLISYLGLSSAFHEYYIMGIFKLLSKIRFGKYPKEFGIDTEYGERMIKGYVEQIISGNGNILNEKGWRSYTGKGIPLIANNKEGKFLTNFGKFLFK